METGIFLAESAIARLSDEARAEIFGLFDGLVVPPDLVGGSGAGGGLDITPAQARKIIADPMSETTRSVLRAIAEIGPNFSFQKLAHHIRRDSSELRGVWSGITRRVRSVIGDRSVELIQWAVEPTYDKGRWIDIDGSVTPKTHAALRDAFGIRG